MDEHLNKKQREEASFVVGEMASGRLFALIHERIEELRERGELSYHDIAERIGATDQQVCRWLSEPRNMTVRSAGRLMAGLEAHLLFELDRYETIYAGNGRSAHSVTRYIPRATSKGMHLAPTSGVQIVAAPVKRTLEEAL